MTTLNDMDARRSRMHAAKDEREAEEKQRRIEKMAELSKAFWPGTIEGNAQRYWQIKGELAKLLSEQSNLRTILQEYMVFSGEVIEVEGQPTLRLDWASEYDSYSGKLEPKYRPVFDPMGKCRRCKAYGVTGQTIKQGLCGSCADDIRGEPPAAPQEPGAGAIGIVDFDGGGLMDSELAR